MSDKETNIEHAESGRRGLAGFASTGSSPMRGPLTRGQRIKRNLKKWWWLYLLVFVCIVVLVVCLIIFVAIPKIAQKRVDDARLKIDGIHVTQTQPDSFALAINATIAADDSIHAVLDPFEGEMYLADLPAPQPAFARVAFPSVTSASLSAVNVTQFTKVLDLAAFTVFNTYLLANDTLRVGVRGDTRLRVRGISRKYGVRFEQAVPIAGLSHLDGTEVEDSRVSLEADEEGNNFFGTAVIPNRSPLTFELGNATFINYMLGQNVGHVYIDDMTLHPGINRFAMRGNISQGPVLQTIQERPYCETGLIPFQLQGLDVVNHGQRLSYFADALASSNQTVEINVMAALNALGLTISCQNTTTRRQESSLEARLGPAGLGVNLWDLED